MADSSSASRSMNTCPASARRPSVARRRPSSRAARRASWITFTIVALACSRAGMNTLLAVLAISRVPACSSLPATMPRNSSRASPALAAAASWRARGSPSSPARRIRSISASTSSGWVPQAGERNSHSLGPRLPCASSRSSSPAKNPAAASPSPTSRPWSPSTPASKAAVNSAEAVTCRLRSHMAKLGAADATPPSPPAIRRS